jgi:hypothetical protein
MSNGLTQAEMMHGEVIEPSPSFSEAELAFTDAEREAEKAKQAAIEARKRAEADVSKIRLKLHEARRSGKIVFKDGRYQVVAPHGAEKLRELTQLEAALSAELDELREAEQAARVRHTELMQRRSTRLQNTLFERNRKAAKDRREAEKETRKKRRGVLSRLVGDK